MSRSPATGRWPCRYCNFWASSMWRCMSSSRRPPCCALSKKRCRWRACPQKARGSATVCMHLPLPRAACAGAQRADHMGGAMANWDSAQGWSPADTAGPPVAALRYAMRPAAGAAALALSSRFSLLCSNGQRRLNGCRPASTESRCTWSRDGEGLRWAIDVPAGVADRPVDHLLLRLPGVGQAAADVAAAAGAASTASGQAGCSCRGT